MNEMNIILFVTWVVMMFLPPYFIWRKWVGLPFWKTIYMYITRNKQ